MRSTAAVNAGLTGSVDRVSLWQHCVDMDRSQETLITWRRSLMVVRFILSVSQKSACMQNGCKRLVTGLKKRVTEIDDKREI